MERITPIRLRRRGITGITKENPAPKTLRFALIVSHLVEKCFLGRSSAGSPAGSGRTTPATWSTPHRGACSVPRDHPTPAPDSPARRQAAEVKMVGYTTVAHGAAQRLSEKWRHFICKLLSSFFCASSRCVGVLVFSPSRMAGIPLFAQGGHEKLTPKKAARAAQNPAQNPFFSLKKRFCAKKRFWG